MPVRPRARRLVAGLVLVSAVGLVSPSRAVLASGAVVGANGVAPVDINYIYSLLDNTNVSTDLTDGKSWLVRYYSRLSGAAGNTPATNPNPCLLNSTTGKNVFAVGGSGASIVNNNVNSGVPGSQDCWWEFMNAWKAEAASQPGMSAANVTDHVYHLGEVDSNPYVSNPQSLTASQPGPQDTIVLTIPGAVHPEQTVVIGEHPDGASLSSWGSAYDDGQGAAVILGVAKSMLTYWTTNHLWPDRTIQFVLFDGEEEGLFGSFFYQATQMPVGAVDANDYVGMFNVDQNGIEYPARHLGTPDKPDQGSWFTNINETPQTDFSFYTQSKYPRLTSNAANIAAFHTETHADLIKTFDELGQVYAGKPMPLADYGVNAGQYPTDCLTAASGVPVSGINCVDTFADHADLQYILDKDDTLGRTDQDPFIRCGIPALGVLGAYDSNGQEPVQNDPLSGVPYAGYDTPVDNIAWLNALASGKPPTTVADVSPPNEINPTTQIGTEALRRSLSFAGDLVLNEATDPSMAGVAPTPTDPIAYFQADRYAEKAGVADAFNAIPSPVAATSWSWSFDDGGTATGPSVQHVFTTAGIHQATLTESAPSGSSTYTAAVNVVAAAADPNTPCGQVGTTAADTASAPTFTNTVGPANNVPESPLAATLLGLGGAAVLVDAVRRRSRAGRRSTPR